MFKIKNKDSRAMTSFCSRVDEDLQHGFLQKIFPLKVNNRDSAITCEICKVDNKDIRTRSMFIVNFELIPHLVLVFLLWSLSMYLFSLCELFYISIVFRFSGFIHFQKGFPRGGMLRGSDLKRNGKCISIKFL